MSKDLENSNHIDHTLLKQPAHVLPGRQKRYRRSRRAKPIALLELLCGLLFCSLLVCSGIGTAIEDKTGFSLMLGPVSNTSQVSAASESLDRSKRLDHNQEVSTSIPASIPSPGVVQLGVYNNPWGYDFRPGELIYHPPAQFCRYFNCVKPFWRQKGFVVQCHDLFFIRVGGRVNACVGHRGLFHVLYAHPHKD